MRRLKRSFFQKVLFELHLTKEREISAIKVKFIEEEKSELSLRFGDIFQLYCFLSIIAYCSEKFVRKFQFLKREIKYGRAGKKFPNDVTVLQFSQYYLKKLSHKIKVRFGITLVRKMCDDIASHEFD